MPVGLECGIESKRAKAVLAEFPANTAFAILRLAPGHPAGYSNPQRKPSGRATRTTGALVFHVEQLDVESKLLARQRVVEVDRRHALVN